MSRWFRHYAGLARDDKLVRAAMKSKQPVERVVWVWCAILESAAEVNDGGRYELDHAECAYFLRTDETDIADIERALVDIARVSAGVVARWSERQFESDRSADRTKRYRERLRSSRDGDVGEPVTSQPVTGDVTVTHHRQSTETDTEKKVPLSSDNGQDEPVAGPETVRQRLWSEGLSGLQALGVREKQARTMMGRWLRDAGDDAERVLGTIQRARDKAPVDPIAWINANFSTARKIQNGRAEQRNELMEALTREDEGQFLDADYEVVGTDYGRPPALVGGR